MKIKRILLASLLLSGAFVVSSCAKKKPVDPTPEKTEEPTTVTPVTTTPDIPTSTYDDTPTTTITIDIDPIEKESTIRTIYSDFNKPKLPSTYMNVSEEQIKVQLSLDSEDQIAKLQQYDCIEQKGIDYTLDGEVEYLIDAFPNLSKDESYAGDILAGVVNDFSNYVDNLLAYETKKYTQIIPEFYVSRIKDKNYFIISIESVDGENRDLVVVDSEGIISYINFTNDDSRIYETGFVKKGTISDSDLETLQRQGVIKYNNDGCEFKIKDYNATSIFVPGYYRTKPFQNMDLSNLDYCNNLEEIVVPQSNKTYKTIDGVLYNYDLTELLYYPKSKVSDEYVMPNTVETIRSGALSNLKGLKSVIFSNSVKSVNDYEFSGSVIESVDIQNVTSIGKEIFKNCLYLSDIKIPFVNKQDDLSIVTLFSEEKNDDLKEVEFDGVIYYVSDIQSLTIKSSNISENLFVGVEDSLVNLTLPSLVTFNEGILNNQFSALENIIINNCEEIGENAFKDFTSLVSITGDKIGIINENAFNGCTALTSFSSDCITIIKDSAFSGCTSLEDINTEKVIDLGLDVFTGTKVNELYLPELVSLKDNQFKDCGAYSIIIPNVTSITSTSFEGATNLENVDISSVTEIPESAFFGISTLKTVSIDSVTTIDDYAFKNCTSLTNINSSTITTLKSQVFYGCSSLESVSLPNITVVPSYAFSKCTSLKTAYMPLVDAARGGAFNSCNSLETLTCKPLTSIGSSAFCQCSKLTTLDVSSITSIPEYAFDGCKLLEIEITNKITSIGKYAYRNCSKLVNADLTNVTTIGEASLVGTSITQVVLNKCTQIGANAFASINTLKSVQINSNATLGLYVFSSCSKLETVVLPSSLTEIPERTFENCSSLANINLSYITSFKEQCFYKCTSLTSLSVSNATFGKNAFYNSGLKTITIGGSTKIEKNVFTDCPYLTTVTITGAANIAASAFASTPVKELYVTGAATIGEKAFSNCSNLEKISITNASVTLNNSIFYSCNSIKDVKIAANFDYNHRLFENCSFKNEASIDWDLTSNFSNTSLIVGDLNLFSKVVLNSLSGTLNFTASSKTKYLEARLITKLAFSSQFKDKTALETVILPKLEKMNDYDFDGCTSLKTVDISSLTSTRTGSFRKCSSLVSIEIPNVESLDSATFAYCTSLVSLTKATKLTSIGSSCFQGCTSIQHFTLSSVTDLGSYAFNGCTNLIDTTFSSIATIGEKAFEGCTSLKSISATKVTSIGNYAFSGCTELATISFSNQLSSVGTGAFVNCSSITKFIYPNITVVNSATFKYCSNLSELTLGNVTKIESYAFSGCSKLSTIPSASTLTSISDYCFENCISLSGGFNNSNLTTIPKYAFSGCTNLASFTFEKVTSIGDYAFYNCGTATGLFSISAYKTTSVGKYAFANTYILGNSGVPRAKSIGDYAFYNTVSYNVAFNSDLTTIGTNAFANIKGLANSNGYKTVTIDLDTTNYSIFRYISSTTAGRVFESIPNKIYINSTNTSYTASTFTTIYNNSSFLSANYTITKQPVFASGVMWQFELTKK